MARSAPAAEANSAWLSPKVAAACPQTALPTATAPKMTVRKIASPRPRTHCGSTFWAET